MLNLYNAAHLLSKLPIRAIHSNAIVPFVLNFNQRRFIAKLQKRIESSHPLPLWAIIVKARRVGVSSIADGLFTVDLHARANIDSRIVAHLADTSESLFRVPTDLEKAMPIPAHQRDILTRSITVRHKEGYSTLSISTAGTVEGGRGGTLNNLHFSEAAFVSGEGALTSLINSVGRYRGNMVFVESTANGKTGVGEAFYNLWQDAVSGRNSFLPVFLSWLDDTSCRMSVKDATYTRELDEDEKDILLLRGCPSQCRSCQLCHIALQSIEWRTWAIYNLCSGYVDRFHREFPTTPDEAFTQTGDPAFTRDELRTAQSTLREGDSVIVELVDPTQSAEQQAEVTDTTKELYPDEALVRPASSYSQIIAARKEPLSPFIIWHYPTPGYHYSIGADAARGVIRGDFAAAVGWCWETGEQVFRYANRLSPEAFAKLLNIAGRYYNGALIAIELTGNLGLWAQAVLRDRFKYNNLYRWKGRDDKYHIGGAKVSASIGWETNVRTRELLLAAFRGGVREKLCIVRDKALYSQMIEAENVQGRWEVDAKIHDDILMAAMIGWIARIQWYNPAKFGTRKKQLDTGLLHTTDEEAKKMLPSSDLDPASQHVQHWNKLMKWIKRGGPEKNRLEGV